MKILYISAVSNQAGGGMSCINRNNRLMHNIPNVELIEYKAPLQSTKEAVIALLTRGNFSISKPEEQKILSLAKEEEVKSAFVEATLNGHLIKSLTSMGIDVTVFAHNVESVLYLQRAQSKFIAIGEWLKYVLAKRNERNCVKYSKTIVALTERDSKGFFKSFGRSADILIPISSPECDNPFDGESKERYALFVGSNFFPNNEGIKWYIENVQPHIDIPLYVVGSCCNAIGIIPESISDKVKLLGVVDDLEYYYKNASCVVAPIFKGSGMKTKTIEAMSYGKSIFGTDECFQGIQCDYKQIGGLCNSAKEFIDALSSSFTKNNEYTLNLFKREYSDDIVQDKFTKLYI